MPNAWRLPDGRVLVPKRAEAEGIIGDGFVLVAGDSADAIAWRRWTKPAPPELVAETQRDDDDRA